MKKRSRKKAAPHVATEGASPAGAGSSRGPPKAKSLSKAAVVEAVQREEQSQRTDFRRSARLAAKPLPVISESATLLSSTEISASAGSDYAVPKTPKRQYRPPRDAHIGWITPPGRLRFKDPRPRAAVVSAVAPSGDRCAGTNRSPNNKTNQVAHLMDRSISSDELTEVEKYFGVQPGSLNVDQRQNLLHLSSEIHIPLDQGLLIILPMFLDLQRLYKAVNTKKIFGWPWAKPPKRNRAGFIHYEEVFPFETDGRNFRLVPLSTWGDAGIQYIQQLPGGKTRRKLYEPPFTTATGRPQLPLMKLHNSPYFVTWKAYKTLKNLSDDVVPPSLRPEVRLVRKIGQIMTGIDKPEADASAST
ncbi:hypothetical protein HDZ31DRAFT_48157 [Schizophyllum fasciatum]